MCSTNRKVTLPILGIINFNNEPQRGDVSLHRQQAYASAGIRPKHQQAEGMYFTHRKATSPNLGVINFNNEPQRGDVSLHRSKAYA